MKQLYIAGQLVDLYQTTVIAQTLQVFDPGQLGSVVTNFTTSIKVPHTRNNERIFGFLRNSKTKSDAPYIQQSVRYVENGIPIIDSGLIVITQSDENQYSFNIYSGPFGFFASIEGKTLWDLDFSDINGPWTQADRDSYRNATTGIVQALVDDDRLVQNQASTAPTIENQGTIVKSPQIYYHTVIEKIFQGFDFDGDIFDNPIFKALAMPLGVIYNDAAWLNSKLFFAAAAGGQVISDPITAEEVLFGVNVRQGSEQFYDGISEYIVSNPDTPLRYFSVRTRVTLTITVVTGTVDIRIEATGYTAAVLPNVGSGTHELEFSPSLGFKDGDIVRVTIIKNSGTPTVTILSGSFYNALITGTTGLEFFPSIVSPYVYFNKLFEDILITDFLREFCVRFGVQITQVNNTLQVNTLNKILDIRTGPDWTLKRDKGADLIKYAFAGYGKTNNIKSPVDTDFTPDLTSEYGTGSFEIPNDNLKDATTVYTSMFYVTEMVNTFSVFMLKLNLEVQMDLVNTARVPGKRLFFVRSKYATEPPALYNTVDRTDYLIGYYFDPQQVNDMSWQYFIDQFQKEFIEKCLRRVRLITREYYLTDLDIFKFNQQEPIYDNSERFLVTKIINRVSRKSCKVELLKIDANPSVTYIENIITAQLTDYLERVGSSSRVFDFMELVNGTISNDLPFFSVRIALKETVTGNPTWRATYNNFSTSRIVQATGDGGNQADSIPVATAVSAAVVKTLNDGNGPNGFTVKAGYVEWTQNGTRRFAKTFASGVPTSTAGLTFTFGITGTPKTDVVTATTASGTLATSFIAGATISGVVLVNGDRILIKNQAASKDNGIRIVQVSGAPARATDADTAAELNSCSVKVSGGTHAGKYFQQNSNVATVDVSPVSFDEVFPLSAGNILRVNIFEDNTTP